MRQTHREELGEEMRAHLALRADDLERGGMSRAEAERRARIEFGGFETYREASHAAAGRQGMARLGQDVRFGLRMLRKSPGFTAVVVLTLALGIGANTAIFSVVNAVLLRPLPFARPGQLMFLSEAEPKAGLTGEGVSWPAFTVLAESGRSFRAVAGLAGHALTLTGRGEPDDLSTVAVTGEFFSVLATKPLLGRALEPADGRDGAAPVAVLSEGLWRSRFGGDPKVVGQAITLDERSYTVAGVMPASFRTPFLSQNEQVWIPLAEDPLFSQWRTRPPTAHWLPVIARLRPGVATEQARAELRTLSAGLARQFPDEKGWRLDVEPLQQTLVGDVRTPLLLLLGAVGLVLLLACANIATLLLARATSRSREVAVRIALGADRRRIARQLLTESALLGVLGGVAGALLAWGGLTVCASLLPPGLSPFHPIGVDGAVLGFALLLSVTASLVFGVAPVLSATRSDPQTNLRGGARTGEARGSQRARRLLAATEVALAMILLAGAGLVLRSFAHLLAVSPGFATEHLVKAEVSLPRYQYTKPEQWAAFANELTERLAARRDLEASALAVPLPIVDDAVPLPFTIAGNAPLAEGKANTADFVSVSPQYFHVMGIALERGRLFTEDDAAQTPPVAVISEALARRYFPGENPLGRRMMFGFPPYGNVAREVVGVVADIHDLSLAQKPGAMMYVPFAQAPFWGAEVVVRSRLGMAQAVDAIRSAANGIDPNLPITQAESLPQALQASVAEPRFRTLLLALFGGIALLLAAVGLYGMISFSVSQQTREIGVRMALGASRGRVQRLVLGDAARLVGLGLAVGIPAALVLTRFLGTMLFGVRPTDPLTFAGVAVVLTGVGLAAAALPARRATRVDPMVALRTE